MLQAGGLMSFHEFRRDPENMVDRDRRNSAPESREA